MDTTPNSIEAKIVEHDLAEHNHNVALTITAMVISQPAKRLLIQGEVLDKLPVGVIAWVVPADGGLVATYHPREDAEPYEDPAEICIAAIAHAAGGFHVKPELMAEALAINNARRGAVIAYESGSGFEWAYDPSLKVKRV